MSGLLAGAAISACATATEEPYVGPEGETTDSTDLGSSTNSGMGGASTMTSSVVSATIAGPGSNADSTSNTSASNDVTSNSSTGSDGTMSSSMGGSSSTADTTSDSTSGGGDSSTGNFSSTTDMGTGGDASTTETATVGGSTMGGNGGAGSTMDSTTATNTTGAGGAMGSCTAPMVDGVLGNHVLETQDAICLRYEEDLAGWGASSFNGRTVSVNGSSLAVGDPLPAKMDGYYFFDVSAGAYTWAAVQTWTN